MADIPPINPGAEPMKKSTGRVQPKKETVRINLPPKPTAAPTIKLPTLPPGASDRRLRRRPAAASGRRSCIEIFRRAGRPGPHGRCRAGRRARHPASGGRPTGGRVEHQPTRQNPRHRRCDCRLGRHWHHGLDDDDAQRRVESLIFWPRTTVFFSYGISINLRPHAG